MAGARFSDAEAMVRSSTELNVEYQKDFSGLIVAWSNGDVVGQIRFIHQIYRIAA